MLTSSPRKPARMRPRPLFFMPPVPLLVATHKGCVLVRVDAETCLLQAAELLSMLGPSAGLKIGERAGESWYYEGTAAE